MAFRIVEVGAMAGDPSHDAAAGPAALSRALALAGHALPVARVTIPPFAGDVPRASAEVARRVATAVRAVVHGRRRALVLAGSCDVAPGVVAGLGARRCGVIWIDAHADFNTPESSASGFWPGMTLAALVGDCGNAIWSALKAQPVAADRVALFGVRSLSPAAEARRLARSQIRVVGWRQGAPQASLRSALDDLSDRVTGVYVHLDLDALDPTIGAGVVDPPVPGGLSARQLEELLAAVQARFSILAATIATYTPSRDDGSTLRVAVAAAQQLITH